MGAQQLHKKELIIKKLITLKVILFIFFGALGCLFPFLPQHMLHVGLNHSEARIISIVSPLISILGPLIFCPIADHLATKKGSYGKHLRIIASITMIIGAIMYLLLLIVPPIKRLREEHPMVRFGCDSDGAILFQKRIESTTSCYYWEKAQFGSFVLTNCTYTCQEPGEYGIIDTTWNRDQQYNSSYSESDEYYDEGKVYKDSTSEDPIEGTIQPVVDEKNYTGIEPPHLCKEGIGDNPTICHVYTEGLSNLTLSATLRAAINNENDTHSAEWCKYPLDGFKCNIPPDQEKLMKNMSESENCQAMIKCALADPYESPGSILDVTLLIGDVDCTFWVYLIIRSIADIFPMATLAILNTAIIIATRETSSGRGDVGHQYVWASIGFALFSPIIGLTIPHTTNYIIPLSIFAILSVISAIILLFSSEMPLSPPEWWWHTKSGMVAIPMSSVRKYCGEAFGLTFITILLGSLWSYIDSYQGWFLNELLDNYRETNLLLSLTITCGALIAIPVLWYAEIIIDYCGHSNILITSFAVYVFRFMLMAIIEYPWLILLIEILEELTLGLTWVTIILYMRHIIPRRITALGQAIPVIAHFCIGKSIGAAFGLIKLDDENTELKTFRETYFIMSAYALIIAVLYFLVYHCILAPFCGAGKMPPPSPGLIEGMRANSGGNGGGGNNNSNGNYTPLRVYHNGRGRKGQFRY